jgi:DNA primase
VVTPDWLQQAKKLPEGQQDRIPHTCGDGRPLVIHHDQDDLWAFCHRCGWYAHLAHDHESLTDRLAKRRSREVVDSVLQRRVELPNPVNFDMTTWPSEAKVWLFKAGLDVQDVANLGAYWHEHSGRVVIPVVDGGTVKYWQARAVDGRDPKYINPRVDRAGLVAKFGTGKTLVLVEDVLSAYRVGKLAESWSLLGTKVPDEILAKVLARGGPVAVWLDPDWSRPAGRRPGVLAARKVIRKLSNAGVQARMILSRADPKLLSDREIRAALNDVGGCP